MRISENRSGQLDFGIRQRRRVADGGEIRHRIIGGIESVGIDMAEISDRRSGAVIGLAVGDPDRRVVAAGIESIDLRADLLVADDLVELAAGEIVQLIGDRRIGRCRDNRRGRSDRGFGSGRCGGGRSGRCRCGRRGNGGSRACRASRGLVGLLRRVGRGGRGRIARSRGRHRRVGGRRVGERATGGCREHQKNGGRGQKPIETNPGHCNSPCGTCAFRPRKPNVLE